MKRGTKPLILPPSNITYAKEDEPIVLSKALFDTLLKQDNCSELIALYCFYYYTAKWQKTNQPKATAEYVGRGLNWSTGRVRKYKNRLRKLNLIEDVCKKDDHGQISGHYIKVKFIWSINHPPCAPDGGDIHPVVLLEGNALSSNNKNNNIKISKITESNFPEFWKLYPSRGSKGAALTSWIKVCKRKGTPSMKVIKQAIKEQKESDQWKADDGKWIPLPTTWLNQSRWMDDASQMKSFIRDFDSKSKPKKVMDYGEWWFLDEKNGKYYNKAGQLLM